MKSEEHEILLSTDFPPCAAFRAQGASLLRRTDQTPRPAHSSASRIGDPLRHMGPRRLQGDGHRSKVPEGSWSFLLSLWWMFQQVSAAKCKRVSATNGKTGTTRSPSQHILLIRILSGKIHRKIYGKKIKNKNKTSTSVKEDFLLYNTMCNTIYKCAPPHSHLCKQFLECTHFKRNKYNYTLSMQITKYARARVPHAAERLFLQHGRWGVQCW